MPPAEPPAPVPVNTRRAAAQRVREARDRLTSTSGTHPAFDHELLRQYAQTRISASYVVMLLVVATGALFGFWMQPIAATAWSLGTLCVHLAIMRHCGRFGKATLDCPGLPPRRQILPGINEIL